MAPDRPKMTPEALIWWESTKNVSRTPFQYKRVTPASLGLKGPPPQLFSLWARWRRAPQGAHSAFSPHYIFCICLCMTPVKKIGALGPRARSWRQFFKNWDSEPFWGPGGAAKRFGPIFLRTGRI